MSFEEDWSAGPHALRPRLGASGLALYLWRAKWLMAAVFTAVALAAAPVIVHLPTKYEAKSRLLVSIGEEYVFRPRVGADGAGLTPEFEQLVQSEIELMRSPVVADQVIERFGLARLYPDFLEGRRFTSRDALQTAATEALLEDFSADAAPRSGIIRAAFRHRDPALSADVLNAIIGAYLAYRSNVFASTSTDALAQQRQSLEAELLEAEAAIRAFLRVNNISDFESERAAAQNLARLIADDLFRAESRARAVDAEVAALRRRLAATPADVDLFVEDSSTEALRALEIEREDLLSRYQPESRPVRAIDRRIAQVRAFLDDSPSAAGTVRRGPNPVHQEIETRLATLEGESRALSAQIAEISLQRDDMRERQARLSDLSPRWLELQRNRQVLEDSLRAVSARELEARSLADLSRRDADNIRVLEPARASQEGDSLKVPLALLAFVCAIIAALAMGFVYAFTRRGFGTAGTFERTTGLPVLAETARR